MSHENLGRQTLFRRPDSVHSPLYVITPIFNSQRYRSRWRLYQDFEKHVIDSGAILITIEAAFGNRDFAITQSNNPNHIQVRIRDSLWVKESLINAAITRLPQDWRYVAWIDADIHFIRNDWVGETIQQLQNYHIVQMFSEAQDLGPNFESILKHQGFMYCYLNNIPKPKTPCYYYHEQIKEEKVIKFHPGFCWAARRSAINYLGGLIDWSPLGAADNHLAHSLIGRVQDSVHPDMHPDYLKSLVRYQERAEKYIQRNVGYVEGLILHYFHGKKADRKYWDRWKILTTNQFRPDIHLKKDWQGIWQFSEENILLRDQIRSYMKGRNEDSIDL